ncbi:MAG TPA: conjugal transfer protein TraF [Marinagarivorans sp.]
MKKALPLLTALLASVFGNQSALAGTFGIYDSRSQAMGGAAVAVGSTGMAAGHNPALLGLYDEDEDTTNNGRYYLPFIVGNLSQVAIDGLELLDDELDIAFDNALNSYNSDPQPELARTASDAALALEEGLTGIANKDIYFSAFIPIIAVAEPAKKGGGGFYLGSRIEGGGRSTIPDDDIALFEDYVQALDNVAQGGYWADVHPELFNAEEGYTDFDPPPLNDPFDQIDSRADLRGLIINEVAVAGALGFDRDNLRVAVGVTPKVMQVRVFDESREVSSDRLEVENSTKPYLMFNADIGVVVEFESGWRLAYVGKDLLRRTFTSNTSARIELDTKHRMGAAYIQPNWQIGVDYDMQANLPVATEKAGQFLSFGGEYTVFERFAFRAGYRYDTDSHIAATTSFGVGASWASAELSLSYVTSKDEQGAALQLGFAF